MKIKMLFLLLISCTYSFAQIVNIPNANFKARLLASNATNYIAENTIGYSIKIDTNNDGQIQVSEALQVISLDVNTAGISNLEGISSFTNLIHLNCSQNYLTTLDVSSLTNMQNLQCAINQLSALNVNTLTHLTDLDCSINQITILDVSNLNQLSILHCYSNLLTSLIMGQLTNITFLNCFDNQLTSLNVGGFTNLIYLNCFENHLTSINLTGTYNLLDLRCYGNQLTSLNVSNLVNLTYFEFSHNPLTSIDISGLISLKKIYLNDTLLTILDASHCIHLEYLYSSYNPTLLSLYIKNSSNEVIELIENTNLQFICCDESQLTDIQNSASTSGSTDYTVTTNCNLSTVDIYNQNDNLIFYPNPVKDYLFFKTNLSLIKVEIFDIDGRILSTTVVTEKKVDLSKLKFGIYILKIYSGNKIITTKILKE